MAGPGYPLQSFGCAKRISASIPCAEDALAPPDYVGYRIPMEAFLRHWRTRRFDGIRPVFCRIAAAETLIQLSPGSSPTSKTRATALKSPAVMAPRTAPSSTTDPPKDLQIISP
jgi:hypothetical protein